MRKFIFAFVACIFALFASAQKITEKDLQGNWKLTGLITAGIALDVRTGKITNSKEAEITIPPDAFTIIKDNIKQYGGSLNNSYTNITGNSIKQVLGDITKNGTFMLKDYKKIQLISIKNDDGTNTEIPIKIVNERLYITNPKNKQELIYNKE